MTIDPTERRCASLASSQGLAMTLSPDEIDRLRRDTPATDRWIHFDHAGALPSPEPVHRRIVEHLELEREMGGYAAMRQVQVELAGFYASIAALIGAQPDQIAFAESATRAWDMAFYGIDLGPGDRILTGQAEYASNFLAFLHVARRKGVEIDVIPDGEDGTLDVAALASRLDDRVKVVNVCHAPTSNGLVNDAEAVGALLDGHPALYLLDACQSIGQRKIDVRRIRCDALSATGRKYLRGPRGTGFLYVSRRGMERIQPPFLDMRAACWRTAGTYELRDDARRFETWESTIAGRLGLKQAVDYAAAIGVERIEATISGLAARLRDGLAAQRGVELLDRGTDRSGIVAFAVNGVDAFDLRDRLNRGSVAVSAIAVTDALLDLEPSGRGSVLRASVHCLNTAQEIERFCELVAEAAPR